MRSETLFILVRNHLQMDFGMARIRSDSLRLDSFPKFVPENVKFFAGSSTIVAKISDWNSIRFNQCYSKLFRNQFPNQSEKASRSHSMQID